MRKHPARTPSAYKNSVPREVRGELQALTVSQSRCEGLGLQILGCLVQELHVIIDPLLCGVRTDLFTPLGLEAVERWHLRSRAQGITHRSPDLNHSCSIDEGAAGRRRRRGREKAKALILLS